MSEEVKIEVYDGLDDAYEEAGTYQEETVSEEEIREPESFAGDASTEQQSNSTAPTTPQPVVNNESSNSEQSAPKKEVKVVKKVPVRKRVVKRKAPAIKVATSNRQGFRIDWTSFFLGMGSAFVIYLSYKKFFKRGK